MRVAFKIVGDVRWIAEEIYLRNLFHALRSKDAAKIRPCVLSSAGQIIDDDFARFVGTENVIRSETPQRWTLSWLLNGVFKRLSLSDKAAGRFLVRNGIDVVFGSTLLFKYPKIGTLSWLPDFQHVHFPNMFSDEERRSRDEQFRQSLVSADRVVLLSEAVKADLLVFAPEYAYKTRPVPPISHITESIYERAPDSVLQAYHLPAKFIYLPNQFWRHKNHEIVFEALRILSEKGIKVTVVCTGYPGDYRNPDYFARL
jgi:hypothetical protein